MFSSTFTSGTPMFLNLTYTGLIFSILCKIVEQQFCFMKDRGHAVAGKETLYTITCKSQIFPHFALKLTESPIFICPFRDRPYYVIGYSGRPHRFPHNNFSSVYRISTKLGHMIPLWKGKNPIYFGGQRSRSLTINIIFDNRVVSAR